MDFFKSDSILYLRKIEEGKRETYKASKREKDSLGCIYRQGVRERVRDSNRLKEIEKEKKRDEERKRKRERKREKERRN
jgi:hypothetical protein